jgi:putative ABC transport system substrate-binding protein
MLETISAAANSFNYGAFRRGLSDLGYFEGQNLDIVYRSAEGHNDRFPTYARELVQLNVHLIVTRGTPAVFAAKAATSTIPIVMAAIGEPLIAVSAIARPGGNVTGLSAFVTDLQSKRVELLKDMLPNLTRVGALMNMGNPVLPPQWSEIERAALSMGLQAQLLDVRSSNDLKAAFDVAGAQKVEALVVAIDSLTQANRELIATLAINHRLPAIFASREFVDAGGLMTYGPSYLDLYHRAASYVDRVLKGTKPSDLPIEQPTKFELIINLKTAKALGLIMAPTLLARADEVIE